MQAASHLPNPERLLMSFIKKNKHILLLALYTVFGIAIITGIHLFGMFDQYDDKCGYRIATFLGTYEHDPFTQKIKATLDESGIGNQLLRMNTYQNFIVNNYVLQWVEKLPPKSAFQSVVIGHWFIHCIMLLSFIALLVVLLKKKSLIVVPVFLASASAFGFVANWILPFDNNFFTNSCWTSLAPRGGSTIAFIGVLVSLALAPTRGYVIACIGVLIFGTLGTLHHVGSGVLFGLVVGTAAVLAIVMRNKKIINHLNGISVLKIMGYVIAGIILVFAIKEIMLILYLKTQGGFSFKNAIASKGILVQMAISTFLACVYTLAVSGLIWYWWEKRAKKTIDPKKPLSNALLLFISLSILALGIYPLAPIGYDFTNLKAFIFFEGTRRIIGLAHGLFWIVVGMMIVDKLKNANYKKFHIVMIVVLTFVCLSLVTGAYRNAKQQTGEKALAANGSVAQFFDKKLMTLRLSEYVTEFKSTGVVDEVRLYSAISNEYRLKYPERY